VTPIRPTVWKAVSRKSRCEEAHKVRRTRVIRTRMRVRIRTRTQVRTRTRVIRMRARKELGGCPLVERIEGIDDGVMK
jgi:hypothetical protein